MTKDLEGVAIAIASEVEKRDCKKSLVSVVIVGRRQRPIVVSQFDSNARHRPPYPLRPPLGINYMIRFVRIGARRNQFMLYYGPLDDGCISFREVWRTEVILFAAGCYGSRRKLLFQTAEQYAIGERFQIVQRCGHAVSNESERSELWDWRKNPVGTIYPINNDQT